ncbi:MAG TPA: hypothetical protein VLA43_07630 [Longimicrobiales bacterium]|nr:hypothetical protein [Longimicrobiales bacterium]
MLSSRRRCPGVRRPLLAVAATSSVLMASGCASETPREPSPWILDEAPFVVTGAEGGDPELFLARNRFDTAWVRLTVHPGLDNSATWSPDGRFVVFHSDRDAGDTPDLDLYRLEPGSGEPPVRLTAERGFDYLPDYAPDGRRIAFLSRRAEAEWPQGSPGHVYVMGADGSGTRRATRLPVAASLGPAWMADGTSLLVARRVEPDGPTVLARIWLDFDAPEDEPLEVRDEILVRDDLFNYTPAPAPDGQRIAYTAEGSEGTAVVILDLVSGERKIVLEGGFNYVDEWTPDGRWILVTRWDPESRSRDPWLLSADGAEAHRPLLEPAHRSGSDVSFRPVKR